MKVVPFVAILASLLLTPLSLRFINDWMDASGTNRSYLPSFETRRTRKGFRPEPIANLQYGNPEWVFIGDSMLGTRIHAGLLGKISGDGTRNVMFLIQAASGPAYWYLTFKNHLVASGVKPRVTFFFFRDTNMTDTMFRLPTLLGDALDEVAHEQEPELDALVAARQRGAWAGVDRVLDALYEVHTASAWMHPTINRWYALRHYPDANERLDFEHRIEQDFNQNFRRDLATDMSTVEDDADFYRDLPTSVLPVIVALSREHHLPVCFVRVQRRPENDMPPPQSPALLKYVADFRSWAESQGAYFYDETGDPELTLDLYEDGDHFLDPITYTKIFRRRLDPLLK